VSDVYEIEAHGCRYRVAAEAGSIVAECAAAGSPYEPRLLERIYEQQFTGVALDVGAHIGNHTLWFAAVCGLDVVAFEPSKAVHELRKNVELNRLGDRVGVHRIALGAVAARGRMADKGRVVAEPWQSMNREVELGEGEVHVHALDVIYTGDREVSVIKIDVEGMESAVIAGAVQTIERFRPVIYTETWGREYTDQVAALLEPLGYERDRQIKTATPLDEWRPN
jgi:FkbM family methyltransferase